VRNGDEIELDVESRRLHLLVEDRELERRKSTWQPPAAPPERGYYKLYHDHVMQADRGADFDFLVGNSGLEVPRESH
jgi:dihydroxy-acid dehydratase